MKSKRIHVALDMVKSDRESQLVVREELAERLSESRFSGRDGL
jgi:hypothetical protein